MEILQPSLIIMSLLTGIAYVGITFPAYSKRIDNSVMGGANMLNGWWVIFPYGKNGISREHKELVIWGRVAICICIASGYSAYAIN